MRQVADPHRSTHVTIAVGDLVLLSTKNIKVQHGGSDKLFPRFLGPFRVIHEVNPVAFRLELPDTDAHSPSVSREFVAQVQA
jgi:hypothetical protein